MEKNKNTSLESFIPWTVFLFAPIIIVSIKISLAPKINHAYRARKIQTLANIKYIHNCIRQFEQDTGRIPTLEEGLMALIQKPLDVNNWYEDGYLDFPELPRDAWGNVFLYELTTDPNNPFQIKSLGADGEPGGEGENIDLLSEPPPKLLSR